MTDPRSEEMERLWAEELMTLREIGAKFGLSYERVRQLLKDRGTQASASEVRAKRLAAKEQARLAELMANAKPCRVCGTPVLRGEFLVTCSAKCSDAWRVLRYHLSLEENEKHRLRCARGILRNAERHSAANVDRSRRLLAGEAIPANRHYVVPTSAAAGYIRELGLDIETSRAQP